MRSRTGSSSSGAARAGHAASLGRAVHQLRVPKISTCAPTPMSAPTSLEHLLRLADVGRATCRCRRRPSWRSSSTTFKEYPPRQRPSSFSIDQIMEKMQRSRSRLTASDERAAGRRDAGRRSRLSQIEEAHPCRSQLQLIGACACRLCCCALRLRAAPARPRQSDPLPSWNDGATKKSITDFVARVTTQGGADFVPPAERIATFDNDGTLWSEQPIYFQFAFAIDRVKALAPQHPEWKTEQPFKAVLDRRHEGAGRRRARRACWRSWRRPTPA